MLRGLLAYETQLTRLEFEKLAGDYATALKIRQLSSLTALQHLDLPDLPALTPRDCRAVAKLQQLTMLGLPECKKVNPCRLTHAQWRQEYHSRQHRARHVLAGERSRNCSGSVPCHVPT
jgi:hypothetical protein